MNFIADEGVDAPIVKELRNQSYKVHYIAEEKPGISDETILGMAYHERRLLITLDKDFGELVFRLRKPHAGIILLRLEGLKPIEKAEIVLNVINKYQKELADNFTVIQKDIVRIRTKPTSL